MAADTQRIDLVMGGMELTRWRYSNEDSARYPGRYLPSVVFTSTGVALDRTGWPWAAAGIRLFNVRVETRDGAKVLVLAFNEKRWFGSDTHFIELPVPQTAEAELAEFAKMLEESNMHVGAGHPKTAKRFDP